MSIASELNRLLQAKSDLATAIANKGVTVPANATLDDYAALVDSIQTGGGSTLPYDSEVEYLQSSNTGSQATRQYILLGISGDAQFEITAQSLATSTQVLIGCTAGGYGGTWFGVTNDKWGSGSSSGQYVNISGSTKVTGALTFSSKSVSGTVDGLSFSRTGTTAFSNWALFATSDSSYGFTGRVYSCKCYKNSELILDLVPVRVGQVGYMYDKVGGELYGNAGGGSFTLGSDVS